jgi:hypothetical protein
MTTEYFRLLNIYKDDCSVCEENAAMLKEAVKQDERITVFDLNFNGDKREFNNWLEQNSITDAPTLVAIKDGKILGKIHGSATVQEVIDLFSEEAES